VALEHPGEHHAISGLRKGFSGTVSDEKNLSGWTAFVPVAPAISARESSGKVSGARKTMARLWQTTIRQEFFMMTRLFFTMLFPRPQSKGTKWQK
jgi:hypothetical protein